MEPTKERIEKEAEDIVNEHYKKKLEAEAEAYADSVDRRGCSFWRGLKLGYLAGKQSEHERAQQELQAYRDSISELLPLAEGCYFFHKEQGSHYEFLSDIETRIERAKSLSSTNKDASDKSSDASNF